MKKCLLIAALAMAFACSAPREKLLEIHLPNDGNLMRYPDVESVQEVLDSVVSMGFNAVVVDIKPPVGYTYYESELLPNVREAKRYPCHEKRDFDMAGTFIAEGHRRGLKVSLSSTTLSMGAWPLDEDGPAYTVPEIGALTCVEYLPCGLRDIKDSREHGIFAFLNPVLPQVRELMVAHVKEVVGKYHPDGFLLDYCRYNNIHSDFSPASREAFEQWLGHEVEDFPQSIFTYRSDWEYDIAPGKYYREWMTWRAGVIHDLVKELAAAVKEVSPKTDVVYWAASWWPSIQRNGQNWAGQGTQWIAGHEGELDFNAPGYEKTGFADCLDIFEMGAYLQHVLGADDPESMEYAVARGKALNAGACRFVGSFAADAEDMREAFSLMYRQTDGISFFAIDACWKDPGLYERLKDAIRYAKESDR